MRFGGIIWPPDGAAGCAVADGASGPPAKLPGATDSAFPGASSAASGAAGELPAPLGRDTTGVERRNCCGADCFPRFSGFAGADPEVATEERDPGCIEAAAAPEEAGLSAAGEPAPVATGAA